MSELETGRAKPPSTPFFLAAGALLLVTFGLQWYFAPEPTAEVPVEAPTVDESVAVAAAAAREALRTANTHSTTLHAPLFDAVIDNVGGGLSSLLLTDRRFRDHEGNPLEMVTTDRAEYRPMAIELPGSGIDPAYWDAEVESETSVVLRHSEGGLEVTRRFSVGEGPYQLIEEVHVHNVGSIERRIRLRVHAYHYVERIEENAGFFSARSTEISTGLCRHDEEVTRKDREDLLDAHGYGGSVDFVGVENSYFAQMLAPMDDVDAERCGMRSSDHGSDGGESIGSLFDVELTYPAVSIGAGGEYSWRVLSYYGPKDWTALEQAGHELTEVVNLGYLAMIARAFARLLGWIHGWAGNWGLAIILLTLMVRIALFPIVERQFRAMAPMRKLKPELDAINKRFPDDLEKRQAGMMELYRKHGVSPFGQMMGCLPLVLQMPVFFALYTSLSTNVELYNQPFALWWQDLSAPDPYFVLPLMLVGLMHLQQRMTPAAMDPQQQKIMMIVMPLMMGFFMLFLPSGLCLYMMTNSVLGIGQQQLNQWRLGREDAHKEAAAATAAAAEASTSDDSSDDSSSSDKKSAGGKGRSPKRRPSRG